MKKILELTGVQKLSREQQGQIKGAFFRASCCPSGSGCLVNWGGQPSCEPGYCDRWGRCIFL